MKKELKHHLIDKRPWGFEEWLTKNEKTTVKILNIKPKKRNSLQTHKNRKEYLYFLDNPAKIILNNKTIKMKKGNSIIINKGDKHRIIGLTKPARILEISFGDFKETDILRIEDDYGRVK